MHHGNTDAYILTHGYTAEDYRRATNNYQREDYDQLLAEAEAEGNGLGFVYMSSVQKSVKRYEKMWAEYDQVKNFASRSTKDSLMDQINKFNRLVRQKAAQDMQDYIIEHEGRIGSWPLSRTDFGFVSENSRTGEDVKVYFDYFSSDFVPSKVDIVDDREHTTYAQQPGLTYRMECIPEDSDEYTAFRKKLNKMKEKKVVTLDKRSKNNWNTIFVVVLAAVFLIPVVMMLFWKLLGIDRDAALAPLTWFISLGKVTAVIALVPAFVVLFLHILYEVLCISNIVFLISILILLAISLYLLFWVRKDGTWISKAEALAGDAHIREINRLESSDEYKRLKEENEEYRESQRAFAEIWHKK